MSRYGRSDDYYDDKYHSSSYRSSSYDREARRSSRGSGGESYYDSSATGATSNRDAYRGDFYGRDSYRGDYYGGGGRGGGYRGNNNYMNSSRPPRNKLYVGNLSSRTNERDLRDAFSRIGPVMDVVMKYDFAFIEYEDKRDMEKAIDELDRYMMHGRELLVEPARRGPRVSRGNNNNPRTGWNRRPAGMRPARGKYRLHVLDISSSTSWQDLKDWARKAGDSVVYGDVYVEDGRRIGTVEFDSADDFDNALKNLENEKLHNRYVQVYREGELPPPNHDDLDPVSGGNAGPSTADVTKSESDYGRSRKRDRSHDSRRSHSRSRSRSAGRRRDDRSFSRSGSPRSHSLRSESPAMRRQIDDDIEDRKTEDNQIIASDSISTGDSLAPVTVDPILQAPEKDDAKTE